MIRRMKDGNTAARESKSEVDFFPLVWTWREVVMKAGPEIKQKPLPSDRQGVSANNGSSVVDSWPRPSKTQLRLMD